ncbi:IS66 family insertion sequence element accessory protein TnpA [Methylomonas lenta]|uniref:IS66 family insertion sequence element accessory protein TnpA n=1 Tax=Methylomonas lenta TaxID=980561 RepID=UPI000AB95402
MAVASKWRQHIEAWQRSGLSQRDYCAQQQINFRTFTCPIERVSKTACGDASNAIRCAYRMLPLGASFAIVAPRRLAWHNLFGCTLIALTRYGYV